MVIVDPLGRDRLVGYLSDEVRYIAAESMKGFLDKLPPRVRNAYETADTDDAMMSRECDPLAQLARMMLVSSLVANPPASDAEDYVEQLIVGPVTSPGLDVHARRIGRLSNLGAGHLYVGYVGAAGKKGDPFDYLGSRIKAANSSKGAWPDLYEVLCAARKDEFVEGIYTLPVNLFEGAFRDAVRKDLDYLCASMPKLPYRESGMSVAAGRERVR